MTQTELIYSAFREHPQVTTDSRNCPAGSIFFALKGGNFDGNAYARSAIEAGCSLAVIDNPEYAERDNERIILVDDALAALQDLARHHRRQLGTPIIGITGTNGKTTTKELTAAVLARKYNVLFTEGNLNNHIGVPKTLLRLTREHEVAVIEMGANHPGEIKTLVEIAEPDYGLITNVGKAHLQGFGSFEGVIRTKGELYDYLRQHSGKAFVNKRNQYLMAMTDGLQTLEYGDEGAVVSCNPFLNISYEGEDVRTHLVGSYNIDNLLAAAAVGRQFGVSDKDIRTALADYVPSNNRSQLTKTKLNTLVIDAYNANPTSMAAAIDNFRLMDMPHKMVILGDMGELGESSNEEHEKVIRSLHACQFPTVWLVGSEFRQASNRLSTLTQGIRLFDNVDEVKRELEANKVEGRTILIKGSNSTRLYTLPEWL